MLKCIDWIFPRIGCPLLSGFPFIFEGVAHSIKAIVFLLFPGETSHGGSAQQSGVSSSAKMSTLIGRSIRARYRTLWEWETKKKLIKSGEITRHFLFDFYSVSMAKRGVFIVWFHCDSLLFFFFYCPHWCSFHGLPASLAGNIDWC